LYTILSNKAAQDLLRYIAQHLEMAGESVTSNEWNQCFMHSKQTSVAKFYFV